MIAFLALSCACSSSAQFPPVILHLPGGLPSDTIAVAYVAYGTFGSYGQYEIIRSSSPSYVIRASADTRTANRIQVFPWTPGCEISTFDLSLTASSDIERSFSCAPLNHIVLAGRVRKLKIPQKGDVELSLVYSADWLCTQIPHGIRKGLFKGVSCLVPEFLLGTTKLNADGGFEISLPGLSLGSGTFLAQGKVELTLRNKATGGLILIEPEPEEWKDDNGLRVANSYPQGLVFVERALK
jgi:hypothetical protein